MQTRYESSHIANSAIKSTSKNCFNAYHELAKGCATWGKNVKLHVRNDAFYSWIIEQNNLLPFCLSQIITGHLFVSPVK